MLSSFSVGQPYRACERSLGRATGGPRDLAEWMGAWWRDRSG